MAKILWAVRVCVCVCVQLNVHAQACICFFLWSKGSFYEMTLVKPTLVFYLFASDLILVPLRLSLLHHPLCCDE